MLVESDLQGGVGEFRAFSEYCAASFWGWDAYRELPGSRMDRAERAQPRERVMDITEIKIYPVQEEKLKAFVSIVLDGCFMVNDIKVINGKDGLFISMPSRRKKNGKFKDVAHPLNNDTRQMMERQILEEYGVVVDGKPGPVRTRNAQPITAVPAKTTEVVEGDGDGRTVDDVAEAHLRDSFWGT